MKRVISYLFSALVVILIIAAPAQAWWSGDQNIYAGGYLDGWIDFFNSILESAPDLSDGNSHSLPEPGTMAVLAGLVAGGVIARKVLKRK